MGNLGDSAELGGNLNKYGSYGSKGSSGSKGSN